MSEPEVIDRVAVNDLLETTGNDPAFMVELIDTYLVDSAALLATMEQAVSGGDVEALRRAAHSLKSNSASLGARTLSSLCQALEYQARDGDLEDAPARLVKLTSSFADAQRELLAMRGEFVER